MLWRCFGDEAPAKLQANLDEAPGMPTANSLVDALDHSFIIQLACFTMAILSSIQIASFIQACL
jgi:hypothetical protein